MQECLNVARLQEESSHKTKVYSTDSMLYVKLAWEVKFWRTRGLFLSRALVLAFEQLLNLTITR